MFRQFVSKKTLLKPPIALLIFAVAFAPLQGVTATKVRPSPEVRATGFATRHSAANNLPRLWSSRAVGQPPVAKGFSTQVSSPLEYVIGSVPPLEVRQGDSLKFHVRTSAVGSAHFGYTFDPEYPVPAGSISFDDSGVFAYTPVAADKFEFRVTLAGTVPGNAPESQAVVIRPIASLLPETDTLENTAPSPDPADPRYLLVTQSQNVTQELHNGIVRATWNVDISGKDVIFDRGAANHGDLYSRFHNRPDVKAMTIYAERLIVRSALRLPGTTVTVYARYLRFEDTGDQGSLDTTPLPYASAAVQFQNGADGEKAGDIILHVQNFYAQPGPAVRFLVRGGRGQDAGQGRPGNPSSWTSPWKMRMAWTGAGYVPVLDWPFRHQGWGWVVAQYGGWVQQPLPGVMYVSDPSGCGYGRGQQMWPPNRGEDAVSPGVPGTGGPGGVVSSSVLDVSAKLDLAGGPSGAPGLAQPGGPPPQPASAVWLRTIDGRRCSDDYFNFQVAALYNLPPGRDAQPVPPTQAQGANGAFTFLSDPSPVSWLHPNLLRFVLAYAKDLYRAGHLSETQATLQDYSLLLSQYTTFPEATALDLQQNQNEIGSLLHRLANNLDYFSHTAGWVPLLTLEAAMRAFSAEVDAAIPVLFLSRWLQAKADQNLKDLTALQETMSRLSDEATTTGSDVNAALANVPGLQRQAADINAMLQNVHVLLQQRETALLELAQRDVTAQRQVPFWKKALRVIGTVAQTVPAYQPALGAIGQGLNFVANFDTSQPLQSLQNTPDITSLFKATTWVNSENNFNAFLKSVDFRSFANDKSVAKELGDAYKGHADLIKQTILQLHTTQIADGDVQKEFNQLKAGDSQFNDLIQQVSDLQAQKQIFAQSVANTLQEIADDHATITKDLLSIGSMYQNLNSTAAQFDHGMVGYITDMDRRARERLLRYQYFMAKAYEYRMLQPYPGDLNIDSVVDKILAVMGSDGYAGLGSATDIAAIKSVYLDSVRQIISLALTQLAIEPPERSLPFYFDLTNKQLQQLNETGLLTLDLAPLIAGLPNEDNRHIAALVVSNLRVQTTGPVGPVARVRLVINHQGQSIETLNGRSFKFHFGTGQNDQPISYGAVFNVPNGPLSQEAPSTAGLSLLQSVLNIPGSIDPLALFARPGADAVVTIRKYQDPATLNATLTGVQIAVTVDFFRSTSANVRLNVQTNQFGSPYIVINQSDITGRQDGVGGFTRTFLAGQPVTLTAERLYGNLRFEKWVDASGRALGTAPTLTLVMSTEQDVRAIYRPVLEPPTTPRPRNKALGVPTNAMLTWVGLGATSYDVYFGPSNPPPLVSTGQSSALYATAALLNGMTYYWQIVAHGGDGTADGSLWSFTTGSGGAHTSVVGDFDGDGKADITVFRPSNGTWYTRYTAAPTDAALAWGGDSDIPVPGDYDGDGKTDIAVFRPSNGTWYIRYSGTPTSAALAWGGGSDIPVPGDYDGDGITDIAVFRPSNGTWYILYSGTSTSAALTWGGGDDAPVPGDYDGDGLTDIAVFRPSSGTWYIRYTGTPTSAAIVWGGGSDIPVPADYDGDGKRDIAVFRPSTGTWYIRYTETPTSAAIVWGGGSDIPVPGDFDGDGKTDIAVFRPSSGTWYIRYTGTPTSAAIVWGGGSDIPILKRP